MTSGIDQSTNFISTYENTFVVTQGVNQIILPTEVILDTTDFLYFYSNDTGLLSVFSSNSSDFVLSQFKLARIDQVENFKFKIKMILDYYIYSDTFTLSNIYDETGVYNVLFQVGNVGQDSTTVVIQFNILSMSLTFACTLVPNGCLIGTFQPGQIIIISESTQLALSFKGHDFVKNTADPYALNFTYTNESK